MPGKALADLQQITVRPDWEAAEDSARTEAARRRLQFEIALLLYGIVTIGLSIRAGGTAWAVLVHWLLFAAILLVLPLWIALEGHPDRPRVIPRFALVAGAAIALAILTTPPAYRSTPIQWMPALPPWLSLAIPLLMGTMLAWSGSRYPRVRRKLGLLEPWWGRQMVIGLSLGAALGLHMISTIVSLPGAAPVRLPGLANLAWLVGVSAGLFAVGQEISLRGLLHTLLGPRPGAGQIPAWGVIILLNLLLYAAPGSATELTPVLIVSLAYEALFAFLAMMLRLRSGSIIAPVSANAAFCVFLLSVFLR